MSEASSTLSDAGVIGQQSMADGQLLVTRSWPLPGAPRAVLLVHGLGEHSGRYAALASWFCGRGYAVRSFDQRGHGQSPGPRSALLQCDDLLRDLTEIYQAFAAQCAAPPLLLGHSMGGLVVARTVLDGRIAPSAMVLSSPALRSWESPAMQKLAGVLNRVAPRLRLRNGLKTDKLSHDSKVVQNYQNDELCHHSVTPRLADFIFRAGITSIADAGSLALPTLLLVADSDALVDPGGSREFARTAAVTGQLTTRYFSTLYHELFNEAEPGRTQVLMQMADWLERLT